MNCSTFLKFFLVEVGTFYPKFSDDPGSLRDDGLAIHHIVHDL